jgi:hypothetical protein
MAQGEANKGGGWLAGLRNKASEAIEKQQANFALGKVAGVAVLDAQGVPIVEAGQRIDEAMVAQAVQCGQIAALSAAALQGQKQDLKEKVQAQYAKTDRGRESHLLDSVEEFAEAHRYLGRATTMDVTDIRGNILVPSGKVLDAEDAQRARDAGQLGALLVAARESVPAPQTPEREAYKPASTLSRPRTLLAEPEDESD